MVKLQSTTAVAMAAYFTRDPLEFDSMGRIVNLLIKQEADPVQLVIEKNGSELVLSVGDGSGDPTIVDAGTFQIYKSSLPAGATSRYSWIDPNSATQLGDVGDTFTLEAAINLLVADDVLFPDGHLLVVDQSRAVLAVVAGTDKGDYQEEEVATFINEESLAWE